MKPWVLFPALRQTDIQTAKEKPLRLKVTKTSGVLVSPKVLQIKNSAWMNSKTRDWSCSPAVVPQPHSENHRQPRNSQSDLPVSPLGTDIFPQRWEKVGWPRTSSGGQRGKWFPCGHKDLIVLSSERKLENRLQKQAYLCIRSCFL